MNGSINSTIDPLAIPASVAAASKGQAIYIIEQGQEPVQYSIASPVAIQIPQNLSLTTNVTTNNVGSSKKRKRNTNANNSESDVTSGHAPKKIRMNHGPPGPRDDKKNPLPSTTTVETATTEAEERAIRHAYVTVDGKHICGECGNSLATSWGLDAHIKSVHGKKGFKCKFCDKSFGRKDHLVNHTKSMHTGTKECSQCGFVCSGKDGLTKHIAENHPIIPTMFHQCSDCGSSYPSESACKIHISQEHTLVACQECGTLCAGTEGLKKHVTEVHVKNKSQHAVLPPQNQQQRLQIEVVFKCEFCSGTFSQQSSLDEHIRSFHMDLQCVACGSSLVGTQAALTHIQEAHQASKVMFNTGEICYNCEICDSTFDKGHLYDEHFLQNHIFSKVGNELVRLPTLPSLPTSSTALTSPPSASALLSSLQKPVDQQSLNIAYQCVHCDDLFSDQQQLTKHMDSTHPETFALPTEPLPPSVLAEFAQSDQKPVVPTSIKQEEKVFFQCLICEQLFLEAEQLHAHMKECHHHSKGNGSNNGASVVTSTAVVSSSTITPSSSSSINNGPTTLVSTSEAAATPPSSSSSTHDNGTDGTEKSLYVRYECDRCKSLFDDKDQLESHIVQEHHDKIKGEDKVLSSSSENLGDESGLVDEKYHQLFGNTANL